MHCQSLIYIIFITMTLGLWSRVRADLFTAISDIEPLLDTHKKVVDDFDNYVAKEEKRLIVLKRHLNRYKKEHALAMQNIKDYLENPINAFTLIKRLTTDLDFLRKSIMVSPDYIANVTVNDSNVIYPTLEDLTGAVLALARLQKTYKLDVGELSEGRFNSVISSLPMIASDCFELGRILYDEKDYNKSLHWMMESLRKFKTEDNIYNITEGDALEYISYLHYLLGDIPTALEWIQKLLVLDPENPKVNEYVSKYQKAIEEEELKKLQKEETGHDENEDEDPSQISDDEDEDLTIYEALCRGDIDISSKIKKKLKCTYLTENHPYLKLAPIKREQIYIAPDVFVFYDVISDGEIEHIKKMAKPRIVRSEVREASGKTMTAPYRISKITWLSDQESEVVSRVTRRTADFTGLSMGSAEPLQVANYGIGGHYEPHYDHDEEYSTENRIATVLFYMSDVTQGGATVFTELNLTVFPVKNSALFWMNLDHSGVGNNASRHAACPVLQGSKWAANKWIHVRGQELIMPCDLNF